jgi:hypothetical protein
MKILGKTWKSERLIKGRLVPGIIFPGTLLFLGIQLFLGIPLFPEILLS